MVILPWLLALLPLSAQVPAAAPRPGKLAVHAELVGRAEACPLPGCKELFFVRLELRNRAARALTIHQMSCSWTDSWQVQGPYTMDVVLCDKNVPTSITLQPRQALVFYGQLCGARPATRTARLRLGFVALQYEDFDAERPGQSLLAYAAGKQRPVFWSNTLTDDFSNDSYRLSQD
jgi:hypothetical protein